MFTVPAGGALTTYQYQPSENISFRLYMWSDDGRLVTTEGIPMRIDTFMSKYIGGSDRVAMFHLDFTTNRSCEYYDMTLTKNIIDLFPEYPYYNAKYLNLSTNKDITMRIQILMNE